MRRLVLLLCLAPALGLVLYEPLPELCARSDAAILGEVTTVESRWTPTGGLETHAWIAVQEVVVGDLADDTVEIVWAGGRSGDLVQRVEDEPELRVDRRYLLLLEPRPDGAFAVTGGERGAVPVPHGDDGRAARAALEDCRVP